MAIYQCNICSEKKESSAQPEICDSCGTQNGPWTKIVDGLTRVTLSSGANTYIIYADNDLSRVEFKQFFSDVIDEEGDGIYKYCEPGKVGIRFSKNSEGVFEASSPDNSTNYFLHKGIRLESSPVKIRTGDQINLFSINKGKVVAIFNIS